ncbi:MAG: hypothetical protein HGA67_01660 [Candidatus Yonathbacteria bacterium]|nr:hypothetical protein [Candidatus Yonathbacteria bacterium]
MLRFTETITDKQVMVLADAKPGTIFRFADTSSIFMEASSDVPGLYLVIGKASTNETYILPLDTKGGILKRKDVRRIISYPGEIRPTQPKMKKVHLRDAAPGTIVRLAPENNRPSVSAEELGAMEQTPAYIVIGAVQNNRVPVAPINFDQKDPWVSSPEMDDDIMVINYECGVVIPMGIATS